MDVLRFPRPESLRIRSRRLLSFECLEVRQLLTATTGNIPPEAVRDVVATTGNTPIVIEVLRNDTDADGTLDVSTVKISSNPKAGTVEILPSGNVKYTPPLNRFGIDSFFYNVKDDVGAASNEAEVVITVRSIWQNPENPLDVNNDGAVSPIDVLRLVNELNGGGSRLLETPPMAPAAPPPFLDPTGDGYLTPADVLYAINCLNAQSENSQATFPLPELSVFTGPSEASNPVDPNGATGAQSPSSTLPPDNVGGSGSPSDVLLEEDKPAPPTPEQGEGESFAAYTAVAGESGSVYDRAVDTLLKQGSLDPLLPGSIESLSLL